MVTANQRHGVGLWDVRRPGKLVLEFGAVGGRQQTSMYVRWNRRGDSILGLRLVFFSFDIINTQHNDHNVQRSSGHLL